MSVGYDCLVQIVQPGSPPDVRLAGMRGFAEELGWTPSYEFQRQLSPERITDHLIVEHGLENTAIISFLPSAARPTELSQDSLRALLTLSYNNLVEWHVFVSDTEVRYVNNLTSPSADFVRQLSRYDTHFASSNYFQELVNEITLRRNVIPCDDLLISTISRWKRLISSDYEGRIDNEKISALVNLIILARGCEDYRSFVSPSGHHLLLDKLKLQNEQHVDLSEVFRQAFAFLDIGIESVNFLRFNLLSELTQFDKSTAYDLFRDFYRPSAAPFSFNFAFMSKHALSRIYERYVSLLEFGEGDPEQLSFLKEIPREIASAKSGAVYTPQFIAGFFARFLRENMTPRTFRELRAIDPACGSGIFLRSLLELQGSPFTVGATRQSIISNFAGVRAIDRDPNACEATALSLALLHLVAVGALPESLKVSRGDAVALALEQELPMASFGAVLTNPPYVKLENLSPKELEIYGSYLGDEASGRIDSYIAFVKLCLELVADGGFVCLVLPQAFLLADNARFLRKRIAESFNVRCIVDLSSVRVFEGLGIYTLLLVVEKKRPFVVAQAPAQVASCEGLVGPALQACLEGRSVETPYYRVFKVDQSFFSLDRWVIMEPAEIQLRQELRNFKSLSEYLTVRQGIVTGDDEVFVVPKSAIPRGEETLYKPYLRDREIFRYKTPDSVDFFMFYPFEDGRAFTEEEIVGEFPETWRYLLSSRERLEQRGPVKRADAPWWRPAWPRDPKVLLGPKIVCPHLMLTPRFAVDLEGRYLVSRSPFASAATKPEAATLVSFFCAVLNSSVVAWYISTHAFKYSQGYNRIEVALLRHIPVPDPASLRADRLVGLLRLVDTAIREGPDQELDERIDDVVFDCYGFSTTDRQWLRGNP